MFEMHTQSSSLFLVWFKMLDGRLCHEVCPRKLFCSFDGQFNRSIELCLLHSTAGSFAAPASTGIQTTLEAADLALESIVLPPEVHVDAL